MIPFYGDRMEAAVSTLSSMEAKAGCGCSAGGVFPGVLPGMGTQQCWGRTRRGNGSSIGCADESASSDHVPQRPAARNDPALAVVFPGKVGYGCETSLGKAKNRMPIQLFILSKQGNVMGNIIESDREYLVLSLQCIPLKIMNTKQIAKKVQILQKKRRGKRKESKRRKKVIFSFFNSCTGNILTLPWHALMRWQVILQH